MRNLFAALAFASMSLNAQASGPLPACVPGEGLALGGIDFSDNRASVVAALGQPERTASYQGEDDGGLYTGTTMVYAQIELDVDQRRGVERISSDSPDVVLPYGLKLGMSIEDVATLLRFVPAGLGNNALATLPVCNELYDTKLQLRFLGGKLSSVQISEYGP